MFSFFFFFLTDTDISEHKAVIDFLLSAMEIFQQVSLASLHKGPSGWPGVPFHFTDKAMEMQGARSAVGGSAGVGQPQQWLTGQSHRDSRP